MTLIAVVLIGIAVLVGFAVVLSLGDSPMSDEPVDRVDAGIPDRLLTARDVGRLRFRVGLRGYRMDDVDAALLQIRQSLAALEVGTTVDDDLADVVPAQPEA